MIFCKLVLIFALIVLAKTDYTKPFFENILKSVEITPQCRTQFHKFIANLSTTHPSWAQQMVEAYGKLPRGLVPTRFNDVGEFDDCVNVIGDGVLGQYCLGEVTVGGKASELFRPEEPHQNLWWSVCLPNLCTNEDVNTLGKLMMRRVLHETNITVDFHEDFCQTKTKMYPKLDTGAKLTLGTIIVLVALVAISTIKDLNEEKCAPIFKAFSIASNSKLIFNMDTRYDAYPFLNGLRVIITAGVVLVHHCQIAALEGFLIDFEYIGRWRNIFFTASTVGSDSYLTLGAFLLASRFFHKPESNILKYYLKRYIRFTVPFALLVLFQSHLLHYLSSGPLWPLNLLDTRSCRKDWMIVLTYLHNYINDGFMCLDHTWYLCVDMHMFVLSPLIFYGLLRKTKLTLSVLLFACLASMSYSFYITKKLALDAVGFSLKEEKTFIFYIHYYYLTHTRMPTWIIGVLTAYFAYVKGQYNFHIKQKIVWLLWLYTGVVFVGVFAVGYYILPSTPYKPLANALYSAVVRPIWSLGVAWLIIACITNNGGLAKWVLSWPIFQVMNKFSVGVFLVNLPVTHYILRSYKYAHIFTDFEKVYLVGGNYVITYAIALIPMFLIEYPVLVLLAYFSRKTKKSE